MGHGHGNTKARKHENDHRAKNGEAKRTLKEHPESGSAKGKGIDPLTPEVLAVLEKHTGLGSAEAWRNIWFLTSKAEQDNDDLAGTFLTDKGESLFGYASALSYDFKDRGVTLGIVGWTTANDGKDANGDAPELFKIYKSLGGQDLMPLAAGCTKSKDACATLIKKIQSIADDPKWIQAQWTQLVTKSDTGAYIYNTMETFKKIGIEKPTPLAIATILDCSLNQGFDGKDGGCTNLIKLAVKGDEDATLAKYNKWRRGVAGTNEYNEPRSNGEARADMYEKLRKAKVFSLTGEAAAKAVKDAVSWEMK